MCVLKLVFNPRVFRGGGGGGVHWNQSGEFFAVICQMIIDYFNSRKFIISQRSSREIFVIVEANLWIKGLGSTGTLPHPQASKFPKKLCV